MSTPAPAVRADPTRPGVLHVRARRDVVAVSQTYEGQTFYVIKNPAALRYFRLRPEGYFVLGQLDGTRTVDEICRAFEQAFPTQHLTPEDLNTFVDELRAARLLQVSTAHGVEELYKEYQKRWVNGAKQVISQFLFLRIPMVNPDRLLTRMLPYFRWVFSRPVQVASVVLIVAALSMVVLRWGAFTSRLPSFWAFFNWRNILVFWIALGLAKICHEFGHGLTCKYFGGECHEMGVLFLVFTPCLYCNVSDAWMIRRKQHKILIGLAGIYVELVLAALATFVWWYSADGFIHTLSLSMMTVCSVSTIVFNGNPLLRYDGYYVLSDWLEIPNLRMKSNRALWGWVGQTCAGIEIPQAHMPQRRRAWFAVYAVASYIYRWIVLLGIVFFLYTFLRPHRLAVISVALGLVGSVVMFVLPVVQGVKMLWKMRRRIEIDYRRVAVTAAVLLVAAYLVFWLPLPLRIGCSAQLYPIRPNVLYARTPGSLSKLAVREGQTVVAGQVLAVLSNPDKHTEYARLEAEAKRLQALAGTCRATREMALFASTLEALRQIRSTLSERADELRRLTIRAPQAGTVLRIPDDESLGSRLDTGTVVCVVGDPRSLEARMVIDQQDHSLASVGAPVTLRLYAEPGAVIHGHVRQISQGKVEQMPAALSQRTGGEVASTVDPKTGTATPVHTSYTVVVELDRPPPWLWPGLRGYGRVDCGTLSPAGRAWRWLVRTFRFRLML